MFWSRKTFAPDKYNMVLMGDSRVYRGLSPEVMEEKLPKMKILNFGYSNGGLNPTMFEAASEKLNPKSKVKVMVLGVTANAITGFTQHNDQYVQELTRPREEVLERLYLNPVLYWFSATNPEALKESFKPKDTTSYYLSEYHMNGYVESDKFPEDTTEAIASYTHDFTNYKVKTSAVSMLAEEVKQWTSKGITVIAYRPPISQPMRELEDSLGRYNEGLIRQKIEQAGGYWISVNPNKYKTYDGSHLDRPSAEQFSKNLALQIKQVLQADELKKY